MSNEWWNNPCEIANPVREPTIQMVEFKDWNLNGIISQTNYGLKQASHDKDEFALKTFGKKFNELFKEQKYDWLPDLPKTLGASLHEDYLASLRYVKTFQQVYRDLQLCAVGIQQIIIDENRGGTLSNMRQKPGFQMMFESREAELKSVLCEMQITMISINMRLPEDVSRDIMPDDYRYDLDQSALERRNYIIFKEYLNTLEYIQEVFTFFRCMQAKEKGEHTC